MVYDLSKEIDEMIGVITDPVIETPPVEDPPVEIQTELPLEEPPVEVPPVEVPPEEPPAEEPPAEEPPAVVPEVPPAVEEPSEETREELLERVKKLTDRVEELTVLEPVSPAPAPVEEPPEKPPVITPLEVPAKPVEELERIDFLGDASIDDVLDNKEALNTLLNTVVAQATGAAQRKAYERVLLSVPDLVLGHINRQSVITKMVSDFYEVNDDLIPVKKTVGAIANTVHAEHPDWQLEEVFKEAATRTRTTLGLREKVGKRETLITDDPAFVKTGGGKIVKKTVTSLQNEIDDLLTK